MFKICHIMVLGVLCVSARVSALDQLPGNSFILAHLPTVETERCILRAVQVEDAKDIFEFTSDSQVAALTAMFTLHATPQETLAYVQHIVEESKQGHEAYWVIVHKQTNKVIGLVIFYAYSPHHARIALGYTVARPYWNKGIATEVAKAMVSFGFTTLGCKRIEATAHPHNGASLRVLEKCGMSYEGLLRCYYLNQGKRSDRKIYSIIAEDVC